MNKFAVNKYFYLFHENKIAKIKKPFIRMFIPQLLSIITVFILKELNILI